MPLQRWLPKRIDAPPAPAMFEAALRDALASGSFGSLLSTVALLLSGAHENGSALAPTNATSHWIWGERAMRKRRFSVAHTVAGYSIHHAASLLWATIYELLAQRTAPNGPGRAAGLAVAVSAVAYFVDFTLTPRRLTPGFERHLPRRKRAMVYAAFAAGMALPAVMNSPQMKRLAQKIRVHNATRRHTQARRTLPGNGATASSEMSRFTDVKSGAKPSTWK